MAGLVCPLAVGWQEFTLYCRFLGIVSSPDYIYGAVIWIAGVLLWSSYVLPKVWQVEGE